jgi:methyl-accepting chemotaxis protein
MKIRQKLILSNLIVICIAVAIGVTFIIETNGLLDTVKKEVPAAVKQLSDKSYLDSLAQFIRYYDEALTQSARNYSFTGDVQWKNRYNSVINDLDVKIKEANARGNNTEKKFFKTVKDSNLALVVLEERSFALVDSGDKKGAVDVLESKEYGYLKKVYADGLAAYLNERGVQYQQALVASTQAVQDIGTNIVDSISRLLIFFATGIVLGIFIALLFVWYFSRMFTRPLHDLKSATDAIAKGNLDKKVIIGSHDEFADLARSFNTMTAKLRDAMRNVEQKVAQRTKALESLNRHMVGREMKMVELKKKLRDMQVNKDVK